MTSHGWPEYAKDKSGYDSSDSYAEAPGNDDPDVEGLRVGKIQGDQEHDAAEHTKKRVRWTCSLSQCEKEQDRSDGQEKRLWPQRERSPSEISDAEGRDRGA